jgi:hypothetical protein
MQAKTSGAAPDWSGRKRDRVRQFERPRWREQEFYITGSSTGGLPELTPTDCVRVVAYDFARNWLRYEGGCDSIIRIVDARCDLRIRFTDLSGDSLSRLSFVGNASRSRTDNFEVRCLRHAGNGVRNNAPVQGERSSKQKGFRHGGTLSRHCGFREKSRRRIRCPDARTRAAEAVRKWPAICGHSGQNARAPRQIAE